VIVLDTVATLLQVRATLFVRRANVQFFIGMQIADTDRCRFDIESTRQRESGSFHRVYLKNSVGLFPVSYCAPTDSVVSPLRDAGSLLSTPRPSATTKPNSRQTRDIIDSVARRRCCRSQSILFRVNAPSQPIVFDCLPGGRFRCSSELQQP